MGYSKIFFIFLLAEVILFSCSKNVLDLRPLGQLDATAVTNKQGVDCAFNRSLFSFGWGRFTQFNLPLGICRFELVIRVYYR